MDIKSSKYEVGLNQENRHQMNGIEDTMLTFSSKYKIDILVFKLNQQAMLIFLKLSMNWNFKKGHIKNLLTNMEGKYFISFQ